MLLHTVTLGGGEAVELHREGDRAALVLRSTTGNEILRVPFEATPENLRAAVQAVARVKRRHGSVDELRQRAAEVRRAAWDAFGEPDFDTGRVLAAEILLGLPLDEDIGQNPQSDAAAVDLAERRLKAAQMGADLRLVPVNLAFAPAGSLLEFYRESRQPIYTAPNEFSEMRGWYYDLPSHHRIARRDFKHPLSIPWEFGDPRGGARIELTPRAAAAVPWAALFSGIRMEPEQVRQKIMASVHAAAKAAEAADAPRDARIDFELKWLHHPHSMPELQPLPVVGYHRGHDLVIDLRDPKENHSAAEIVAEHVGLETGLERPHLPRRRR